MLKTYIRDELASLARHGILSVEEQERAAAWAREASFVPGVAAEVPVPRRHAGDASRGRARGSLSGRGRLSRSERLSDRAAQRSSERAGVRGSHHMGDLDRSPSRGHPCARAGVRDSHLMGDLDRSRSSGVDVPPRGNALGRTVEMSHPVGSPRPDGRDVPPRGDLAAIRSRCPTGWDSSRQTCLTRCRTRSIEGSQRGPTGAPRPPRAWPARPRRRPREWRASRRRPQGRGIPPAAGPPGRRR